MSAGRAADRGKPDIECMIEHSTSRDVALHFEVRDQSRRVIGIAELSDGESDITLRGLMDDLFFHGFFSVCFRLFTEIELAPDTRDVPRNAPVPEHGEDVEEDAIKGRRESGVGVFHGVCFHGVWFFGVL